MIETRTGIGNVQINKGNDNRPKLISGYAIKWDSWSSQIKENGKIFYERFTKGAFKESLQNINQLALVKHELNQRIASVDDETLFLEEDEVGLAFKIILPDNGFGKRTFREVENGVLSYASIGFANSVESWSTCDGKQYRTITKSDLGEISLVGNPAYEDTIATCGDQRGRLMLLHKINNLQFEIKRRELLAKVNSVLNG